MYGRTLINNLQYMYDVWREVLKREFRSNGTVAHYDFSQCRNLNNIILKKQLYSDTGFFLVSGGVIIIITIFVCTHINKFIKFEFLAMILAINWNKITKNILDIFLHWSLWCLFLVSTFSSVLYILQSREYNFKISENFF